MRKIFTLCFVLFTLICYNADAQFTGFHYIDEIFVHDTTYEVLAADTSAGYAGYTYSWVFEDGSTHTGQVVKYPFTDAHPSSKTCSLTVTDPAGLSQMETLTISCNYVLNCSQMAPAASVTVGWWGSSIILYENRGTGPNNVKLYLWNTTVNDYRLKRNIHVNWGNGRTVYATTVSDTMDFIGGPTDTAHAPDYMYGGEYIVTGDIFFSFDTMTCPVHKLDTMVIHATGQTAHPAFTGVQAAYCYGDSLRIIATDTTAQFHNIYHNVDTTGIHYWAWPMYFYSLPSSSRTSYSFEWFDPSNNLISTDTFFSISHLTFADTGIYTLHVYESLANVDSYFYVHVNVDSGIVASHITGTPTLCEASATTLTGNMPGGVWSSSSPAATVAGDVVTGMSSGTSVISYIVANGCSTAVDTMEVTVKPQPFAGTITGASAVCIGSSTTLTNTATGGTWSSSTASATISGGVVTAVAAGTSVISYSVTNSCGTAVDTLTMRIDNMPDAGTIVGSTTVCLSTPVTLTNAATGGTWSSSSSAAVVTAGMVTGIATGTDIISYSITNSCGTAVDTMLVTVGDVPFAGSILGNTFVCIGAPITLTSSVAGGMWGSSSPAATINSGVVTGLTTGISIISYSVSNYCGTATDTMLLTVNALPADSTITGEDSTCEGLSMMLHGSVGNGIWSSDNVAVGRVSGTGLFTGIATGSVVIAYSVTNVCGTVAATRNIQVLPADECGNTNPTIFNIYPNPSKGLFTVEIPSSRKASAIVVMDVTGRSIQTIYSAAKQRYIPVDLSNMPAGTYIVKLVTDSKTYVGKVTKY